jgi:hypothetical protein
MSKDKETAATDAAQKQDVRQFVDTGLPRQVPQPETVETDDTS